MTIILLFGSSGSIGSYIYKHALEKGHVIPCRAYETLDIQYKFDIVIWAQGVNTNDSIGELKEYDEIMNGNVNFVVKSLNWLVENNRLNNGARLCVISSIWEIMARKNKFSYCVSKAALGGLVRSAAADLISKNIYINSILPGPIDNNMTRKNLTQEQIEKLPGFVNLEDIWNTILLICFSKSCINGQSIILDHGFSVIRDL
jgi:NAD(P)-dependent dehydrogenase (short-subunit alcohol dehydrogenase family)